MTAKIEKFEDILVWQKSRTLCNSIYSEFLSSKDYSFRDQLQRAAVSIMNNIAEGYERKGDKQFKNFLFISKGSAGEVRSMLVLALDLQYIDAEKYQELFSLAEEISKMLSAFIKKLD